MFDAELTNLPWTWVCHRSFGKRMSIISTRCSLLLFEGKSGVCVRCGRVLHGRQTKWCGHACEDRHWEQHSWSLARVLALKRDGHACVKCGETQGLSVDHIIGVMGNGYGSGCIHHLSNLQTLCQPCHVAKTAADVELLRQLRKIPPRVPRPRKKGHA